jgi:hypothetical protein
MAIGKERGVRGEKKKKGLEESSSLVELIRFHDAAAVNDIHLKAR